MRIVALCETTGKLPSGQRSLIFDLFDYTDRSMGWRQNRNRLSKSCGCNKIRGTFSQLEDEGATANLKQIGKLFNGMLLGIAGKTAGKRGHSLGMPGFENNNVRYISFFTCCADHFL